MFRGGLLPASSSSSTPTAAATGLLEALALLCASLSVLRLLLHALHLRGRSFAGSVKAAFRCRPLLLRTLCLRFLLSGGRPRRKRSAHRTRPPTVSNQNAEEPSAPTGDGSGDGAADEGDADQSAGRRSGGGDHDREHEPANPDGAGEHSQATGHPQNAG